MKINTNKLKKDIRIFMFIWATIMLVLGYLIYGNNIQTSIITFVLAVIFAVGGSLTPLRFELLYKNWIKFGDFSGKIISRFILSIIYFLIFTPISFYFKIIRRDIFHKRIDRDKTTYWKMRANHDQSMLNRY